MSNYNKLFAAILSTLVSRWLLDYLNVDAAALGVQADLQMAVSLAIDAAVAGFNGFWVWLLPNGWFWKRPVK
jgi:hypothetical protein